VTDQYFDVPHIYTQQQHAAPTVILYITGSRKHARLYTRVRRRVFSYSARFIYSTALDTS